MDHELPERDVYDPEVHGQLGRTPRPARSRYEDPRPRVKVLCPYCPAETYVVVDPGLSAAGLAAEESRVLRLHIDEAHPGREMP